MAYLGGLVLTPSVSSICYLFIYLSSIICLSTTYASIIYLSIYLSIIYLSIIYVSMSPTIHPSIRLPTYHLSIYLYHLSICLCIYLCHMHGKSLCDSARALTMKSLPRGSQGPVWQLPWEPAPLTHCFPPPQMVGSLRRPATVLSLLGTICTSPPAPRTGRCFSQSQRQPSPSIKIFGFTVLSSHVTTSAFSSEPSEGLAEDRLSMHVKSSPWFGRDLHCAEPR